MRKKNILVITGTRAEYGLLKSTIDELMKSSKLNLCLLVTGMHTLKKYGLTIDEIREDGVPIAHIVSVGVRDDMLTAFSKEVVGIKKYCEANRPDMIIVLGDRDEAFAGGIVGGHLGIPTAHIHGGDVSAGVVDGSIRDSITKFSHLHFTVSSYSYARVVGLGEKTWRVFNVGAPGLDAIKHMSFIDRITLSRDMGWNVDKKWIVILQHPEYLDVLPVRNQFCTTMKAIQNIDAEKIIIYPNSDTGSSDIIREIEKAQINPGYYAYPNLSREEYLSLLKHADILVGNSSSGIIESGSLGIPVINIGNRQNGRESGSNVIHVPYNSEKIARAIRRALTPSFQKYIRSVKDPYGNGTAGRAIVRNIERYINNKRLLDK